MQIMREFAATIERLLPRIGTCQLADVRAHEPGTGEINFGPAPRRRPRWLLRWIGSNTILRVTPSRA